MLKSNSTATETKGSTTTIEQESVTEITSGATVPKTKKRPKATPKKHIRRRTKINSWEETTFVRNQEKQELTQAIPKGTRTMNFEVVSNIRNTACKLDACEQRRSAKKLE